MNTIDPKTGLPMQQPVFPPTAQQAGQAMFGTQQPGSYDRVMPQAGVSAPFQFTDQTGDGKITQADVIKARTEGYKK